MSDVGEDAYVEHDHLSLAEVLRHPSFVVLLVHTGLFQSQRLSEIFLRSWVAFELTDSGTVVGAVAATQTLPTVIFSFLAGPAIDKWSQRPLLLSMSAISFLANATLLMVSISTGLEVWHLVASSAVFGMVLAVTMPSRHTLVSDVVGVSGLVSGLSLFGMISACTRIAFPAAIGALIVVASVSAAFGLVTALSFAILALTLFLPRTTRPRTEAPVRDLFIAGLRNLRGDSGTILLIAANCARTAFGRPHRLLPLFSKVWGVGASGLGIAYGVGGFSNAVGSMYASRLGLSPRALQRSFVLLSLGGLAIAAFAVSPWLALALAPLAFASACDTACGVMWNSFIQVQSEEFKGRNIATLFGLEEGIEALFALPLGILADLISPQVTFATAGCALTAIALIQRYSWLPRATIRFPRPGPSIN